MGRPKKVVETAETNVKANIVKVWCSHCDYLGGLTQVEPEIQYNICPACNGKGWLQPWNELKTTK